MLMAHKTEAGRGCAHQRRLDMQVFNAPTTSILHAVPVPGYAVFNASFTSAPFTSVPIPCSYLTCCTLHSLCVQTSTMNRVSQSAMQHVLYDEHNPIDLNQIPSANYRKSLEKSHTRDIIKQKCPAGMVVQILPTLQDIKSTLCVTQQENCKLERDSMYSNEFG